MTEEEVTKTESPKAESKKVLATATDNRLKAPGDKKDYKTVIEVLDPGAKTATEAIFTTLYILYKGNIISRMNLRQLLRIIKDSDTEKLKDIAAYLASEAAKA